MLFIDSGARLSEIAGIKVDDLYLERNNTALVMGKGRLPRAIAFEAQTAMALDRYLRVRNQRPDRAAPDLWLGQVRTHEGERTCPTHPAARSGGRAHDPPAHVPSHDGPQLSCRRRNGGRLDVPRRLEEPRDAPCLRSLRRGAARARSPQKPKPGGSSHAAAVAARLSDWPTRSAQRQFLYGDALCESLPKPLRWPTHRELGAGLTSICPKPR